MREERNQPREVKKISRKMLKKRQNEVKRNIFLFNEVKKHSRTRPDEQFKEFSLTKQKTRPKRDYEWIGKTIYKKNLLQKIEKKE